MPDEQPVMRTVSLRRVTGDLLDRVLGRLQDNSAMTSDDATSLPTESAESEDPFELFDRAMGADTCRDPYPEFAEARRKSPVQKVEADALMGEGGSNLGLDLPVVYQALSHDAVSEVLRDGKRFSSQAYAASIGLVMGPTILVMDDPEHARYRALIQMAFRRKALERWEHELVRPRSTPPEVSRTRPSRLTGGAQARVRTSHILFSRSGEGGIRTHGDRETTTP